LLIKTLIDFSLGLNSWREDDCLILISNEFQLYSVFQKKDSFTLFFVVLGIQKSRALRSEYPDESPTYDGSMSAK
jgi:hypothetical protein